MIKINKMFLICLFLVINVFSHENNVKDSLEPLLLSIYKCDVDATKKLLNDLNLTAVQKNKLNFIANERVKYRRNILIAGKTYFWIGGKDDRSFWNDLKHLILGGSFWGLGCYLSRLNNNSIYGNLGLSIFIICCLEKISIIDRDNEELYQSSIAIKTLLGSTK